MYAVQPYLFQTIFNHSRDFQQEVEQLAALHSLKVEGGFPALELQMTPFFQAILEYTLMSENGVIAIKGKLQFEDPSTVMLEPFPVFVRFSMGSYPDMDGAYVKSRIEEYFSRDVDLQWYLDPSLQDNHVELSLQFLYTPSSGTLLEYARYIMGILTGRVLAA